MTTIKFFKDNAGYNSAFRLDFGSEDSNSKNFDETSILFCGRIHPLSKEAIMLIKFKNLPSFMNEFDYINTWAAIQSFGSEIKEEEFNTIAVEKFKIITNNVG